VYLQYISAAAGTNKSHKVDPRTGYVYVLVRRLRQEPRTNLVLLMLTRNRKAKSRSRLAYVTGTWYY
jgi:hypothetical protein